MVDGFTRLERMKEIPIKKYVRYLFGISILVFILNKFYLRPWVLENELPIPIQIMVLSIPNFIEAIVGTLIATGILLQLRQYFDKTIGDIKDTYIHLIAASVVAIYVISQELKFHNLGGNNVYDPYDVIASIIGLLLTLGLIQAWGFVENRDP